MKEPDYDKYKDNYDSPSSVKPQPDDANHEDFFLRFYDYEACLEEYEKRILNMKRATVKGKKAIAKPALLASIIIMYTLGEINGPRFYLTPRMRFLYDTIMKWAKSNTPTKIEYPFYFLRSDGFWHLNWWNGIEVETKAPTAKFLEEHVASVKLDDDLWFLIANAEYRGRLMKFIRENMLPEWKQE